MLSNLFCEVLILTSEKDTEKKKKTNIPHEHMCKGSKIFNKSSYMKKVKNHDQGKFFSGTSGWFNIPKKKKKNQWMQFIVFVN